MREGEGLGAGAHWESQQLVVGLGGDLMAMAAFQGVRRRASRRGGVAHSGGARGHDGGTRGRQWPRQRRAVASAALGGAAGKRKQRRGGAQERVREVQGCVASPGTSRGRQQAGGGRTHACLRWPRASHPPGGRLRVTGTALWAGPHSSRPASWIGKCQVSFSFSLFCFCFLFLTFVLIWFLNQTNFVASDKFCRD